MRGLVNQLWLHDEALCSHSGNACYCPTHSCLPVLLPAAHLHTYKAAQVLILLREVGAEGQRVQLAEHRRLLEIAEHALKLCKPAVPVMEWRQQQHNELRTSWQLLAGLESAAQGRDFFQAGTFDMPAQPFNFIEIQGCAACSATAHLKQCSACKVGWIWPHAAKISSRCACSATIGQSGVSCRA